MGLRVFVLGSLLLLLTACGGSGDSKISPQTPQNPNPNNELSPSLSEDGLNIYYPAQFLVNQAASFVVTATAGALQTVSWQQSAGPTLRFLAAHTQVISFDVPAAGNYTLELTAVTQNGNTVSKTLNFSARESTSALSSIRLDHAAVEQAKVSLRVDKSGLASNKNINAINWQQSAGPRVEMEQNGHYLFFNAPTVTRDTVLAFSATISFSDGTTGTDSSFLLVKNASINNEGFFPKYAERIVTPDVFAYRAQGPYADVLVDCVYNNQLASSCSFAQLPLIGMDHSDPDISDILDRLVVSHAWMGERFKQFLEQSSTSQDMLKLLRATTAIVISYDVRPSFYWSATGAIYLDAANFWVTPEERDTLNDQPDYRSEFGNDLRFMLPWRYVKNNQYYIRNSDYPVAERLTRSFDALEASASWLMYHELAHANDFFQPTAWANVASSSSPLAYANQVAPASAEFSQLYPLNSNEMQALAQVSFAGQTATSYQKSVEASDVVSFFTPDQAPDYYCYSTEREDYATLFGHFMMAYRLGVSTDVAIISTVANDELNVSWGQRNRINAPGIQPRVRAVVSNIFPQLNVAQIQSELPAPILMQAGLDWFSNIELNSTAPANVQFKMQPNIPADPSDYWQTVKRGPALPER